MPISRKTELDRLSTDTVLFIVLLVLLAILNSGV
jgi:hypothetical protein